MEPLLLLFPGAEQPEVLSRPWDDVGKQLNHNSADVLIWWSTVVNDFLKTAAAFSQLRFEMHLQY